SAEFRLNKTPSDQPGWYPSPVAKRKLLEDYKVGLFGRQYLNRSEASLDECLEFEYTKTGTIEHGRILLDNDPTGTRENHGDRVVADALSWMMGAAKVGRPREREKEEPVRVGSLAWRRLLNENVRREEAAWS